jgi:tRNA (guanine-N7-)-methyltransferase
MYKQVLKPGGFIHLKTDSPDLYHFTKRVMEMYNIECAEQYDNVYAQTDSAVLKIKTHYEALDIANSNRIFYLKFTLPSEIPDKDEILQEFLKATENKPAHEQVD